jgi:nucleotide-binding universal stress UspA family protein
MDQGKMQHVLAAIDFSAHSERALEVAASLARAFHARLTLLHVIEPQFEMGALAYGIEPDLARYAERTERAALANLEAWARRVEDLDVQILLKRGTASLEIVNTATEDACDVIVIATHGQSSLRYMIFGSTAERVVRKARCPVLTVPPVNIAETEDD